MKPEATHTAVSEKKTTKGLSVEEELIRDAKLKRLKKLKISKSVHRHFPIQEMMQIGKMIKELFKIPKAKIKMF